MDQIRTALNWLKAQHFWVLTAIALVIAFACWHVAAGELAKQFKENKSKIDSEFSAQQNRQRQPFHPNQKVNEGQEKQIEDLAKKVGTVWAGLYQRQRDEVLKWPEQLNRGNRSFTNHISGKSFGDFIADSYRDVYLNYIKNRFADLPKIINALELDENGRVAGGGRGFGGLDAEFGGMGADGEIVEEQDYLVRWEDQLLVKQQLAWNSRPSSLKIWVTQEDLWVYETLLKAIAATNKAAGADRASNAAVRIIYEMQVGSQAATSQRTASRLFRPESEGGGLGGGMGMEMGMGMDMGMEGGMGMEMGMDMGMEGGVGMGRGGEFGMGGGEGQNDQTLLMNRYVDANDQPLPAPAEGSPMEFGREYKRLPVKLSLNMDQRWLPRLIVELANAPLQIEVQEVRINPAESSGGGSMAGGARPKRLRALELAGRSGSRGGGSFLDGGGAGGEVEAFPREPHVADVILRGTVFLFNPPDEEALTTDSEADSLAGGDI